MLRSEDSAIRYSAIDALGKTGDAKAVGPLIELLGDQDMGFRASCALANIGQVAVEPLIELLEDQNCPARYGAVDALGEIGDDRAVKPLLELLGSPDWNLRSDASTALAKIGAAAVEPLIELLTDRDITKQVWAIHTLGKIGDCRAIEPLICALWDSDDAVSMCAAEALDTIDYTWTEGELVRKHLASLEEALMTGTMALKFCLVSILERINHPSVSTMLKKALQFQEKNLQARVMEALERIKGRGWC